MANRVFLHVGAPKSGTTYLQTVLWANRELLRRRGVLLPGDRPFDHNRASMAVRKGRLDRSDVWGRFVEQSRRWKGDVVISHEWFVAATPERARQALRSLEGESVHVVFTARDFVRQVPAGWQESLKLGFGWSLEEFVQGLETGRNRWSWRALDPAVGLPPWTVGLPPEHVHVVTVPAERGDQGLLWRRFAQACSFDPEGADTGAAQANESLGAESARWLQRIGPALREAVGADQGSWQVQYDWIRNTVSHDMLVPLGGSRIGVPEDLATALRERGRATADALTAAGYDLVGRLTDLTEGGPEPTRRSPADVGEAELLAPAAALTAALLARLKETTERAERAERALVPRQRRRAQRVRAALVSRVRRHRAGGQ